MIKLASMTEKRETHHLIRGREAEAWARQYLEQQGLQQLDTNFRGKHGEIDLVMRDKNTLVFVEVRYRNTNRYGGAAASIGAAKQQRLRATAEEYLQQHPQMAQQPCRFDVIAITQQQSSHHVQWLKNAF